MESSTSLRVIIVGAGIAGLAAAVALRKAGHSIEVSAKLSGVIAALHVPAYHLRSSPPQYRFSSGHNSRMRRGQQSQ